MYEGHQSVGPLTLQTSKDHLDNLWVVSKVSLPPEATSIVPIATNTTTGVPVFLPELTTPKHDENIIDLPKDSMVVASTEQNLACNPAPQDSKEPAPAITEVAIPGI